jgi:hypothetical protein
MRKNRPDSSVACFTLLLASFLKRLCCPTRPVTAYIRIRSLNECFGATGSVLFLRLSILPFHEGIRIATAYPNHRSSPANFLIRLTRLAAVFQIANRCYVNEQSLTL